MISVNMLMSGFTLVSFYTPDWKYPEYAKLLQEDCQRLGIDFCIEPKDNTGDYVQNCNMKPNFIREKLLELKRPVLWMDVDGSIVRVPNEFDQVQEFDILVYTKTNNPDRIYVNTLLFNYTDTVVNFLDVWCEHTKNFIDDGAFNSAFASHQPKPNIKILPKEQFHIVTSRDSEIAPEVCFVNRLSSSDLKWQYKHKVERRR